MSQHIALLNKACDLCLRKIRHLVFEQYKNHRVEGEQFLSLEIIKVNLTSYIQYNRCSCVYAHKRVTDIILAVSLERITTLTVPVIVIHNSLLPRGRGKKDTL